MVMVHKVHGYGAWLRSMVMVHGYGAWLRLISLFHVLVFSLMCSYYCKLLASLIKAYYYYYYDMVILLLN
jgi:hypothetical protein